MTASIDWQVVIFLFFSLLGGVVAFVLYFANRNTSFSPRILALVIITISIVLLGNSLLISYEYLNYPHLWRSPAFFSLCVSPLSYIYVRSVLRQQFTSTPTDGLLFIPAILYTLQFLPFYILPSEEKLEIIKRGLVDKVAFAREPEGMIPDGWGIMFRLLYNFGIQMATYILLVRWKKRNRSSIDSSKHNRSIYHWLLYLNLVLFSAFFILIVEYIFQISRFIDLYRLISFTICLTLLFICFFLLFQPNILYGLHGWIIASPSEVQEVPEQHEKPYTQKKVTISLDQGKEYKNIIEKHFTENTPFLKKRYTVSLLSEETGIPTYHLSLFINQEYGKNFNEFINDYRVSYLDSLLHQQPEYHQYTLEALGQLGGFNSRTSFITAVKKRTGKNPSDYFHKK